MRSINGNFYHYSKHFHVFCSMLILRRPNLFPLTNSIVLTDIDFTQSPKCTKLVPTCRPEKRGRESKRVRAQRQTCKTEKDYLDKTNSRPNPNDCHQT